MTEEEYNFYYNYYDKDELQSIFSLEALQKLYRYYVDTDEAVTISKVSTLCNILHLKVPKSFKIELEDVKVNDLVVDPKGVVYRLVKLDSIENGRFPMVFCLETNKTFPFIAPLHKCASIECSDHVSILNRRKLETFAKTVNYFQLQDGFVIPIHLIYVLNDEMAELLIAADKYYLLALITNTSKVAKVKVY